MWDKQIINLYGAHILLKITSDLYRECLAFSIYEISLDLTFLLNCNLIIPTLQIKE